MEKVKSRLGVLAVTLALGPAWAQSVLGTRTASNGAASAPFARGEVLNYSVNWPSGLGLGEAQFKAGGAEPGWQFELQMEASLPAFEIRDSYRSSASAQFCSEKLEKEGAHGPRKTRETVTYDREKRVAIRQTSGGGKSEISTPECVKDGLTFLYFLRRELAGGRLPPAQTVNFGAGYQVSVSYVDSPQVEVSGQRQVSDHLQVSFKGPASEHTFELFFARDAARTPLIVRVPFSLGTFTLELAR